MLLTLYDQWGALKTTLSPNDSSRHDKEVQCDNVLSLSFTLYEYVDIEVNDYVDFLGERFWSVERYHPTEKSSVEWEYNVKLYGIESLIKRFLVLRSVDGDADALFTLTARPIEHVRLIVENINAGMDHTTDFKVGTVDGTDNVVIDYTGKYCDEGLRELAEQVGVEWWIEGETVNLCRCEYGEELALGYGNGLTRLERDVADNAKFFTRLFPIGSSRNIDAECYGWSRLQLPGGSKYVDVNVDRYGVIHHFEQAAFSGIYSRRVGVVSSVRSKDVTASDGNAYTVYYFRDDALPFDPNDYELGGLVKHVSFQEGSELAGLGSDDDHYFEVNFDSATREFEIITIWPYDDDTQLPGGTLVPKAGDEYILWNIRMPDEYYALAEAEFRDAVDAYISKHALDVSRYKCPTDHVWVEEHEASFASEHPGEPFLYVGRRVRLESAEYFRDTGYRSSRITRISRKVTLPSEMDLEISDVLSKGTLDKIDDAITDVRTYTGVLVGSMNVPDIIKSWESTRPTDNNLYSARRSHREFLSKRYNDKAAGKITFQQGWNGGAFTPDLTGAGLWKDEYNNWHIESDYLHARKKLVAKEVQIEDVHHVGGQQLLTAASMHADYVVNMDGAWRCFFLKEDDNQRQVTNNWKVGDQAYVNTFNLERQEDGTIGNHRLWRLVTATSNETPDTNTYTVDGETFDASKYHYIDLSKDICDEQSDAPKQGDDIVQLGHQGDDMDRQNATIIAGAGESSPYIREITGIVTFHLPDAETQLKPNDNKLTGKVQMVSGSTFPDGSNVEQFINDTNSNIDGLQNTIETLDTGNENLLLNTGFTGDFTDESVRSDDDVSDDTQMYSRQLKHWEFQNVEVVPTANSASGYGVRLSSGSLSQVLTKPMTNGTWYCISFKASGSSVAVSLGGYQQVVTLTDSIKRYIVKMACEDADANTFTLSGATGLFMEVQVTEGRIPNTDWLPSPQDNDKSLAYYQNLSYLMSAITNASTTILGGLILSQMLRVGNYGDMDKAFYTINKYAQNPAYQPTDEEVAQMAKFVVTHGGRAILNDIILRGYIYALGGRFKGEVVAESGVFRNVHSQDNKFAIDDDGNFSCKDAKISGNMYMPLFEITDANAHNYLIPQISGTWLVRLDLTGLNLQINGTGYAGDVVIALPTTSAYNGAKVHIRNAMANYKVVVDLGSSQHSMIELPFGEFGVFFCYHSSGDNYYWTKIN